LKRYFSLVASASILIYCTLVYFLIRPIHAAGFAQPVLRWLCGLAHLLEVPGVYIRRFFLSPGYEQPTLNSWFAELLCTGIFWFLALSVLHYGWKTINSPRTENSDPTGVSRRSFLWRGVFLCTTAAVGGAGYSFFVEPQILRITRHSIRLRGLVPSLQDLRIVQLTDIHLGPWISQRYIEKVIERTNALEADFIVLTGDYVHKSPRYIAPVVSTLQGLRAKIGIVGILGNHDWWEGAELTRQEFARVGIPLIDNSRMFITKERQLVASSTEGLCIAGVGDLWEDDVNFEKALGGVPPELPRILLSHNPDVAEDSRLSRKEYRVDLMMSGHTHGGQIRIPGFGAPIVPSRYKQKYAQGLVSGPFCPVYISRGIGVTVLPLRFGVPPEIAVFELNAV
jgi:uncharacterized protein